MVVNWIYVSLVSIAFFLTIKKSVVSCFPPPVKLRGQWQKVWLWENLCASWLHSLVSATLSVCSICYTPSMLQDMISAWNDLSYYTLGISIGYFVYDIVDLFIYDRRRSLCIIFHHVLVISSFLVCVIRRRFMPFAMLCLLVEVNSVFLHTRRLMRMRDVDPNGLAAKINRFLLTITFVIFRLVVLTWVIVSMFANRHEMGQFPFTVGFGAVFIATLQNLVLLNQVWQSDAKLRKARVEKKQEAPKMDNNANRLNGGETLKQILQLANACSAAATE